MKTTQSPSKQTALYNCPFHDVKICLLILVQCYFYITGSVLFVPVDVSFSSPHSLSRKRREQGKWKMTVYCLVFWFCCLEQFPSNCEFSRHRMDSIPSWRREHGFHGEDRARLAPLLCSAMGAQQGKENRGSSSSVGSGSHGGKTTKHKSKSKDNTTRISSGPGNIFTEHSGELFYLWLSPVCPILLN